MPTPLYICDACGKRHQRVEDAAVCEQSHARVHRVTDYEYDEGLPEPRRIRVVLDNGQSVFYILQTLD